MASANSSGNPPVRLPLAFSADQRGYSNTLDAKIVNGYVEKDTEGIFKVHKRESFESINAPTTSGAGRGIFIWKGNIYTIVNNVLYQNGALLSNLANSLQPAYWFNTTLGTPSFLYFSNGTYGYTYNGATVAQITDPNYPAATVPGSAYLDGTLYVLDSQARIWGSGGYPFVPNTPTAWNALNVIQAQVEPDLGVAIAKQLIYVIVLKQWTTEVFYDAASATGSALLPVSNAKQPYGCLYPYSVQSVDDVLYWITSNRAGEARAVMMAGLQCQIISTAAVDRFLNTVFVNSSWNTRTNGHTFVGFQCVNILSGAASTLVYDIEQQHWAFWANSLGVGLPISNCGTGEGVLQTVPTLFQDASNGNVYNIIGGSGAISPFQGDLFGYSGSPSATVMDIITPPFDGGARLKKVLSKLRVVADRNSSGTLMIRWSDDDYKTWSSWRSMDLTQAQPEISNLGTFVMRAFQIRHKSPTFCRIQAIELELLLGTL